METAQVATAKGMIRDFYSELVLKKIVTLLFLEITEIRESIKVLKSDISVTSLSSFKDAILIQICNSDKGKKVLSFSLDRIQMRKGDLLESILKEYGIHNMEESTLYRDEMMMIFDEKVNFVRQIVGQGRLDKLTHIMKDF